MTQDFYKDRLIHNGLEVLIPTAEDIDVINNVIFQEAFVVGN